MYVTKEIVLEAIYILIIYTVIQNTCIAILVLHNVENETCIVLNGNWFS